MKSIIINFIKGLNKKETSASDDCTPVTNRQAVYCGNNRILTSTIHGFKFYVNARDTSLSPNIIIDGYWELNISKLLQKLIKPGMTVVEIGANMGYHTILFSSLVGTDGHVHAFEANPEIFDILFDNVAINGLLDRVKLGNKAVWAKTGSVDFFVLERRIGSSSVLPFTEEYLNYQCDKFKKITVPAVSLDEYWSDKNKSIDFIKMDAEGSEPFIFDGMRRILSHNNNLTILCEFSMEFFRKNGRSAASLIDTILSNHFSIYIVTREGEMLPISREGILQLNTLEELVFQR